MRRLSQSLVWAALGLLSACSKPQDDLAQFMQQAGQQATAPIAPLPSVQAFQPRTYNADGQLHDPFVPRRAHVTGVNQPDQKRPREPLEAYPLESLKFVGVLSRQQHTFATIQTPDQLVYQVQPGNYLGEKFGQITRLAENRQTQKYEMTIKETVQDATSGEWTVQMTTLELQEHP